VSKWAANAFRNPEREELGGGRIMPSYAAKVRNWAEPYAAWSNPAVSFWAALGLLAAH
jgi:hypothetical protein